MISQIFKQSDFGALPEKGIEAQKIRALYLAYGADYAFCRFYRDKSCYISILDGAAVVCGDDFNIEELYSFLSMSGCHEIFCGEKTANSLSTLCDCRTDVLNLMQYRGEIYTEPLEYDMMLSDIYRIIADGFDIEFEPWYLDISHKVRHGITRCVSLDGVCALLIQHNLNGEALLSQVATLKTQRRKGYASRLVKAVSSAISPDDVFVICEDSLVSFYKSCGFQECGKKFAIHI
ncbi:MAG: GNAT family N-acetyltransferase [Oscillospiraceae bacterium]